MNPSLKQIYESRNTLSNEFHHDFLIDLQLFGKGKSGGKIFASLLGALVGGFFPAVFAATSWFAGAVMGASLFSGIWAMSHKPDTSSNHQSPSVTRFDREQEQMSSNTAIPLVYGLRLVSGNQTYHSTDADSNVLRKHVCICEGEIEGIVTTTANGLLLACGETEDTVFTIQNKKYKDATVSLSNKHLILSWDGKTKDLYLVNKSDAETADSYYSWQTDVGGLIAYVNRIGEGWEAFPTAVTSSYPGDLRLAGSTKSTNGGASDVFSIAGNHVTGGTWAKFYNGDVPDNYEEVGSYAGLAWVDAQFTVSDNLNGNPSMQFLIKGRKVLDTRTGKVEYSTNPAMCLRDFLLDKRYGCGNFISASDINESSFQEVANYCDEIIKYPQADGSIVSAKRYELNMIIDQKRNAWDWIDDILGSFAGFITIDSGQLNLHVEKAAPPSYHFRERNIAEIKVAMVDLEETPNRYRIQFIDPLNNWQSSVAIVEDFSDQKERGKIIEKEVNLEGVTSQNQALRLARFYRDYNSLCNIKVSFKTGYEAMHLQCGDVVNITYKDIFEQFPIRIEEIKESEKGEYEISGRQYNGSLYNDSLGASIQVYSYAKKGVVIGSVPDVNSLSLSQNFYKDVSGQYHCEVVASWSAPSYGYVKAYNVFRSKDGDTWELATQTSGLTCTLNAQIGDCIYIKVITENINGATSDGVTKSINVTGIDSPPSKVKNVRYSVEESSAYVTWNKNSEPDLKGYIVKGDNGFYEEVTTNSVTVSLREGSNSFSIVAVDYAGNQSTPSNIYIEAVLYPSKVEGLTLLDGGSNIVITWKKSSRASFYNISGSCVAKVYGNQYIFPISQSGKYTFSVTAENMYGMSKKTTASINIEKVRARTIIKQENLMQMFASFKDAALVSRSGSNDKILVKEID